MPQAQPQRIKVLDTRYNKESDLMQWRVLYLSTGNEVIWALMGDDLSNLLRINVTLTPEQKAKFCEDIKGKEKVVINEGLIKEIPAVKDMTTSQMEEISRKMDEFPFGDVLMEMGIKPPEIKDTLFKDEEETE